VGTTTPVLVVMSREGFIVNVTMVDSLAACWIEVVIVVLNAV